VQASIRGFRQNAMQVAKQKQNIIATKNKKKRMLHSFSVLVWIFSSKMEKHVLSKTNVVGIVNI
jgi:hypothetical protein